MPSSKPAAQLDRPKEPLSSRNVTRAQGSRSTIIASILLLLLFFTATFRRSNVTLLWRQLALYDPTHLSRAYRAPMLSCGLPSVINGSYCVFLHQGCSLDKHKHIVGEEAGLDSKIKHCFPETKAHGLYYCANDINDVILDAIRADVVVDMVECDRTSEPLESEDVVIFEGGRVGG